MRTRLRIAVTGLAATYPFGGVFWDYLQYPLGLHRLGHDVLYIEDTGKWSYDPLGATFVEDGSGNAAFLAREIAALDTDLAERWFYRDATGAVYGRPWNEVARFCRSADLFLHVSASCWMREEYFAASRVVFIDSDPMYSQASVPDYLDGTIDDQARARVDMLRQHDVFFTFGENIGSSGCQIPTGLFDWAPTRQPVVLDRFERAAVPIGNRRRLFTTVTSWESSEKRTVVGGVPYGGKASEFERFIDLPARSPLPLELAITGRAPNDRLRHHGWRVADGYALTDNPWAYRDYLASSWGEWSVAKNAYVASHSGWFSCRTACYLALGVPAVVQDTGFDGVIPTGEGILSFTNVDEALDAIDQIVHEPERHSKIARVIAEEYFDSSKVLDQLIERSFTGGR